MSQITVLAAFAALVILGNSQLITDESIAWDWFEQYGHAAAKSGNAGSHLSWAYYTNLTDENQAKMVSLSCFYKISITVFRKKEVGALLI